MQKHKELLLCKNDGMSLIRLTLVLFHLNCQPSYHDCEAARRKSCAETEGNAMESSRKIRKEKRRSKQ